MVKRVVLLIISAIVVGCSNPLEKENRGDTFRIKILTSPEGAGIVHPSQDSVYERDDTVSLRATPAEGYIFRDWSGDISSSENPHSLAVERDYSLTANFEEKSYDLIVNIIGGGAVNEEVVQAKLNDYEYGTVVRLTASPESSYEFIGWEGDIESSENPVELIIDQPKEVTAVFEQKGHELSVLVEGQGTVTQEAVTTKPDDYSSGVQVQLVAEPAEGWQFIRWEGDVPEIDSRKNPIAIQVNYNRSITAVFSKKLEGVISGNRTLTRSEGPYHLTGRVRIANRSSLILEEGVKVYGSSNTSKEGNTIEVFGKLKVEGSGDTKVLLENIVIKPGSNGEGDDEDDFDDDDQDELYEIEIEHAVIIGGELHPPTGSPVYGSISLKNSFLFKVNRSSNNTKYIYIWYPQKRCNIEGNIFYNSGRIDVGNHRAEVQIKNNYFYRDEFLSDETGYAVENWAGSRRSKTVVEGNTFANTEGVAVSFSKGFSNKRMDATKNYWNTTSTDVIERMIYDRNDDRRIFQEISYHPYRRSSHNKTPVLPDSLR